MKRLSNVLIGAGLSAALLAIIAAPAAAQEPKASEPVLLTSCGQSPGPVRVQVFLKQLGIAHDMKEQATAQDIASKKYKTVIIVTGASLKGMGAAGVEMPDELKRTAALIAEARKQGVTIIGAHVEGMARRAAQAAPGDNSDEQSIDAVCPNSNMLLIRTDGDEDKRFTKIAADKKIPMLGFAKAMDIKPVLQKLFGK